MRSDRLVTLVLLVSHELRRSLKKLVKWICGACSRCFGTWGQQDSARTLGPSRWKAGGEMELRLPAEFQAVPCLTVLGRRSRFPQRRNFVCFKLFVPEKRWPIPLPWPIPGLSLIAPARMACPAPTSQLGSGGSPSHPPVQSWMTKNGRIRWQKKDAGATGRVVDRIWWMLNTIWVLFEIIPTEVICGSFWVLFQICLFVHVPIREAAVDSAASIFYQPKTSAALDVEVFMTWISWMILNVWKWNGGNLSFDPQLLLVSTCLRSTLLRQDPLQLLSSKAGGVKNRRWWHICGAQIGRKGKPL